MHPRCQKVVRYADEGQEMTVRATRRRYLQPINRYCNNAYRLRLRRCFTVETDTHDGAQRGSCSLAGGDLPLATPAREQMDGVALTKRG